MARSFPLWLSCSAILANTVSALIPLKAVNYTWPNPQYDALEKLLYEGSRLDGLSLSDAAKGCINRDGKDGRGTGNVAAEWVRFAFHDSITHDIDHGTGGLDASLFLELDRDENRGQGMIDTSAQFLPFAGKYISRADIVAIGTIFGLTACGGQNILPFGGGRQDAVVPGRFGVPTQDQSVEQFNEAFRHLGFNASQAIAITVCGHALGGVRSVDFPDIIPPPSYGDEVIFRNFDTTPQFDLKVVTEFLDGTTQNPLVVNTNQTVISDSRLFNSDGGAVMRIFANAGETGFKIACREAYRVMIDTVPNGVQLSQIDILPAKVIQPRITVENNQLVFKVGLRLSKKGSAPSFRSVSLNWCDRRGQWKDCQGRTNTATVNQTQPTSSSVVTDLLGLNFLLPTFTVPINASGSVGKFWFVVEDANNTSTTYDNSGSGYYFKQDDVIFVPQYSNSKSDTLHTLVGGVRKDLISAGQSAQVFVKTYELAKNNTDLPPQSTFNLVSTHAFPPQDYAFYSGDIMASLPGLTIDIGVTMGYGQVTEEDYLDPSMLGKQVVVDPLLPITTVNSPAFT